MYVKFTQDTEYLHKMSLNSCQKDEQLKTHILYNVILQCSNTTGIILIQCRSRWPQMHGLALAHSALMLV